MEIVEEGDEAKMATACPGIIKHWPSNGVCDEGPKFRCSADGVLFVARIDDALTPAIVDEFAAHPACAGLGVRWYSSLAAVEAAGYERVIEELV